MCVCGDAGSLWDRVSAGIISFTTDTVPNLLLLPSETEHPQVFYIYIYTYVYTYIHTYIHTYVYTYMHTYIHTYIHIYIHICIHTHTDTDTDTHTHTHTHTYTHTHTRTHKNTVLSFTLALLVQKYKYWHLTEPAVDAGRLRSASGCPALLLLY
jgi:hypothetical protein